MPAQPDSSRPATLACAPCRGRHLKCDGGRPICRRCAAEGTECHYTPSRRGQRRRTNRQPSHSGLVGDALIPSSADNSAVFPPALGQQWPRPPTVSPPNGRLDQKPVSVSPPSGFFDNGKPYGEHDSTLMELYFANFHHCHPILVPKYLYNSLQLPESLRAVVRFIGSIICPFTQEQPYRSIAAAALKKETAWDAYRIQAMLLFALALHSTNEEAEAQTYLASAVEQAHLLGMNRYGFAKAAGGGQPLVEESFRRTWWELFTIEGMLAAVQERSSFRCSKVELNTPLPCEDPLYLSGANIPEAPTLDQFDNRLFDDNEMPYSSYCYRIEAIRLLARVLDIAEDPNVDKDSFTAVDNALAGWKHHLPPCKADIARSENAGDVDELMFQAHLIINNATIMLHLPRSNLRSIHPLTTATTCCPWSPALAPTFSQQNHLMKVTAASQALSDLAALRSAHNHTPLLACGLILGTLVQLSICSLHASQCITQHRERVMLMIGVLKSLGRTWPLAQRGLMQVRTYAKEVLQRPCDTPYMRSATSFEANQNMTEMEVTNDHSEASIPIDISWMDELLQQPLQANPTATTMPLNYDSFLGL